MNIAIFTHNFPKNEDDRKNAGILIYDFSKELLKFHNVYIFCPDYINNQNFGGWSIFNPINLIKFCWTVFTGSLDALQFVKKNKINYVLSAWAIPSGIFAYIVKIKLKVPYGIWYLGSDLNLYSKIPVMNLIIKTISKSANNLFANSFALTNFAKKRYGKCEMLPASTKVDTKQIHETKVNKKVTNMLYVGRLEKVKGIDLLLTACKKLNIEFTLRVIGNGTMSKNISYSTKNVIFLGRMNMADISGYMKVSDILIIPSRNESLPLVLIEAANYRLPILASNVGDCKYVLNKYKIGDTFSMGNTNQMARKITNFNYKYYKIHGRFDNLIADYSLKKSVKKFLNIFL